MKEVLTLLSTLGTGQVETAIEPLLAHGDKGVASLLRALAKGTTYGAPDANGRAVMEDLEHALQSCARAHPDVLITFARKHAALLESFAFVSALSGVALPGAMDLLVDLLRARSGAIRWQAVSALLRHEEPRVVARLGALLRDRDGLVVFAAAEALEKWGNTDDILALTAIVDSRKTAPGTRAAAKAALVAIRRRARGGA